MPLFRPYEHDERRRDERRTDQREPEHPEPDGDGAEHGTDEQAGRPSTTPRLDAARTPSAAEASTAAPPAEDAVEETGAAVGTRKNRPTPTRREAEAARRERLNPTISKKEARRRASEANRRTRMEQMSARDSTPAKVLMRDHVDARFNLGEILLPVLLLIVLATFLQTALPQIVLYSTVGMYVFILLVVLDFVRLWRSYKRLAVERGIGLEKGLRLYGMNRMIQLRRMRLPKPQVKRGESY